MILYAYKILLHRGWCELVQDNERVPVTADTCLPISEAERKAVNAWLAIWDDENF